MWGTCVKKIDGVAGEGIASLDCIPTVFSNLLTWALTFAGVVALFFILYGGIRLIMSGGEKTGVDEAKKTITYAIIGLVVILLSFFIINIIAYMTGAQCITKFGFTACQ